MIILLSWILAAHAVENLNCEFALTEKMIAAGAPPVRLTKNQILVRGHLEWDVDSENGGARWFIRDVEGFERMFAKPADSLHRVRNGDALLILNDDHTMLRGGVYREISREHPMIFNGEHVLAAPTPQIFDPGNRGQSLLGTGALCDFFNDRRPAVAVLTLTDAEVNDLRRRLNPQLAAYEKHMQNDARILLMGETAMPVELMHFDAKFDGPIYPDYVNVKGESEGVRADKTKGHVYRLLLRVHHGQRLEDVRRGDRVFLLNAGGEKIFEYLIGTYPIEMTNPPKRKNDQDLILALGAARRAIVIRRVIP